MTRRAEDTKLYQALVSELVPEDIDHVRKLKREICMGGDLLRNDDRLSNGEHAGTFALRMVLKMLITRRRKYVKQTQTRRRLYSLVK